MVEVVVFAEGQSEEQFIKRVVAPALRHLQVFLKPQTLKTSRDAKGGAVNFDRLKFYARNTLRQNPDVVLTTLLDLYGLNTGFPDYQPAARKPNLYDRVACLEAGMHAAILDYVEIRSERFLPYIQPYELEGLLFSDVEAIFVMLRRARERVSILGLSPKAEKKRGCRQNFVYNARLVCAIRSARASR